MEEVVLRLTRSLAKQTGAKNLCLAGGVALNCVANGKVLRDGAFENIWIQPAAGDAGGALGAALAAVPHASRASRARPTAATAWRARSSARASRRPRSSGGSTRRARASRVLDEDAMIEHDRAGARRRSRRSAGSRAAWSSARARSARARSWATRARPRMQKNLNLKIKYRESFRPFAPSVLREDVADWFELECRQPLHAAGRRRARTTGAAR